MKTLLYLSLVLAVVASSVGLQCGSTYDVSEEWKTMKPSCVKLMREQVAEEINASMQYLNMAAHFSKDTVNRPGFAKIFFESAGEERQHALKIIDYLLMRGALVNDFSNLITIQVDKLNTGVGSGLQALEKALELETHVTNKIVNLIKECEKGTSNNQTAVKEEPFNDYHLVDYLSGDFLEEQYQGQKQIADRISTLGKMKDAYGAIGEFLFDKQLLSSE